MWNTLKRLLDFIAGLPDPGRLAGPIFDKELRVSSRRKRNYLLRVTYLVLLICFTSGVWFTTVTIPGGGSPIYQISRTAEAGKTIVSSIIGFQFVVTQFLALTMLSTAISEELYRRTLGVLMTTPINGFQIIMGKLLSKLLQIALLIAISFPALAVVRVLGGVPAAYIGTSLLVTVTSMIFIGSITLFLSVFARHAHVVIMRALVVFTLLFVIPPLTADLLGRYLLPCPALESVALHINPFLVMLANTENMLSPTAAATTISIGRHITFMLATSVAVLGIAIIFVRRAGLREATGQGDLVLLPWKGLFGMQARSRRRPVARGSGRLRGVTGQPIIWKEMQAPFVRARGSRAHFGKVFALILLGVAYGSLAFSDWLDKMEVQTGFVMGYFCLGLLRMSIHAASSLTAEKEAGTLAILLMTSLDEGKIVVGKITGSILRNWPIWALLGGHLIIFTMARCIHPVAIVQLLPVLLGSVIFTAAMGVFFSSCFKRTPAAMAMQLGLTAYICLPFGMGTVFGNPMLLAWGILRATTGRQAARNPAYQLEYEIFPAGDGVYWFTLGMVFIMALLALISLLFIAGAKSNIRKRVL